MTTILGLDPGKTTGYALIEVDENPAGRKIKFVGWGESKDMELIDLAQEIQSSDIVVYEDWQLQSQGKGRYINNKATQSVPAARVIGSVRTLYRLANKDLPKLIVQRRTDKPVGYGLAGMKYHPGKKGMHKEDALAHAVFYAVRVLKALPVNNSST